MTPIGAEKILSANDLGLTGAHQSGILVPKVGELLHVFPALNEHELNPTVFFLAVEAGGQSWRLAFKHYNNRIVGSGTRDEYRITRLARMLRSAGLQPGDRLRFVREANIWRVSWVLGAKPDSPPVLDLTTGSWVSIKI